MVIPLYDNNQYRLKKMTPEDEDLRGLTPLFYHHVNPYKTFELNMNQLKSLWPLFGFYHCILI